MSKNLEWIRPIAATALLVAAFSIATLSEAADHPSASSQPSIAVDSGLYLKVQLSTAVKMSKLKPGDPVEGTLSRDVYSEDRKLFPAGSHVRLTVDHLEKRRRAPNDHWPGVVKLFTPRHESYPIFKTASVSTEEGNERSFQVSLISVSRMREVHAQAKKNKSGQPSAEAGSVEVSRSNTKKPATPTMVLEAFGIENHSSAAEQKNDAKANDEESPEQAPATSEIVPAGTRCKILLLRDLSASKSRPGDVIRARLLEPVLLNSRVALPAGSLVEGKVVKNKPPEWLSRAGSLYITFTGLTLPDGGQFPITASLAGAELDQRSHTKIDSEGQLHGEHPGKAWMAINLGVTAGLAKEADDTFQIIFEAIVSTATDASTAGTARIISSCVSGLYMATRRGRDVVLPRFTEMDISLDRPVSLNTTPPTVAASLAGGK